ncbi:T-cell surface glycoprotein CD3 zeta chain-like [Sinocyclocheilus anshuiensis]|uniref:T-cell surface glycoprotein CD3 zeta chain-like n=1 Tax=Sinocyclocheilus anshuiensis TaxID=1608454 RepID=UPI0007BAAFBE|nr:PREDICTED: T-cell surface glycoprotein CD3 zeta chain-like [Sinocyclocheilus anshuiensis]
MEMSRTITLLFLASHVSSTEAMSASDPTNCFILDVFLLLYSIIFTALYFREKFTREGPVPPDPASPARNPNEPVYTDLDLPQMSSDYQQLDRPIRRREPETHYQELRTHTSDEYQEIRTKGTKPRKGKGKSNEGRTGRNRDAAEAVEMETFPTDTLHN